MALLKVPSQSLDGTLSRLCIIIQFTAINNCAVSSETRRADIPVHVQELHWNKSLRFDLALSVNLMHLYSCKFLHLWAILPVQKELPQMLKCNCTIHRSFFKMRLSFIVLAIRVDTVFYRAIDGVSVQSSRQI